MPAKLAGGTGKASVRCNRPSKSMATASPSDLDLPSSLFFFAASSDLSAACDATPLSSSLSGASGGGRFLRNTATYTPRVTGCASLVMSSQPGDRPLSVLAVKYRYLPLASNCGYRQS